MRGEKMSYSYLEKLDVSDIQLPEHVNARWIIRTMLEHGIPNRGLSEYWCYNDFMENYPELLPKILEVLENTKTGYPSLIIAGLYDHGYIDFAYTKNFIDYDITTPDDIKYPLVAELKNKYIEENWNPLFDSIKNRLPISTVTVLNYQKLGIYLPGARTKEEI